MSMQADPAVPGSTEPSPAAHAAIAGTAARAATAGAAGSATATYAGPSLIVAISRRHAA